MTVLWDTAPCAYSKLKVSKKSVLRRIFEISGGGGAEKIEQ
jgi:hypothetical protein